MLSSCCKKSSGTKISDQNIRKRAFKELREDYAIRYLIHKDRYDEIWTVKHKGSRKSMTVKVKPWRCSRVGELRIWPTLEHENVMPIIDRIFVPGGDVYVMPYYSRTLNWYFVNKSSLKKIEFQVTVKWMEGVLQGLTYLHERGFVYLNLTAVNVHISKSKAVLGDFSYTHEAKHPVRESGLAKFHRPPECFTANKVSGPPVDIWSFGMLALSTWAKLTVKEARSIVNWEKDIFPSVFDCLQRLVSDLQQRFPEEWILPKEEMLALNVVKFCLAYNPESRPNTRRLLEHPLWTPNWTYEQPCHADKIWKIMGSCENTDPYWDEIQSDEVLHNLPASPVFGSFVENKCVDFHEDKDEDSRPLGLKAATLEGNDEILHVHTHELEESNGLAEVADCAQLKLHAFDEDSSALPVSSVLENVDIEKSAEFRTDEDENVYPQVCDTAITEGNDEILHVHTDESEESNGLAEVADCAELKFHSLDEQTSALHVSSVLENVDVEKSAECRTDEDENGRPQECDTVINEAPERACKRSGKWKRFRKWMRKKWTNIRSIGSTKQ